MYNEAKDIRNHAGRNVILYTPAHFRCVANDLQLEITPNRVRDFGAVYTAKEWNAVNLV